MCDSRSVESSEVIVTLVDELRPTSTNGDDDD